MGAVGRKVVEEEEGFEEGVGCVAGFSGGHGRWVRVGQCGGGRRWVGGRGEVDVRGVTRWGDGSLSDARWR